MRPTKNMVISCPWQVHIFLCAWITVIPCLYMDNGHIMPIQGHVHGYAHTYRMLIPSMYTNTCIICPYVMVCASIVFHVALFHLSMKSADSFWRAWIPISIECVLYAVYILNYIKQIYTEFKVYSQHIYTCFTD